MKNFFQKHKIVMILSILLALALMAGGSYYVGANFSDWVGMQATINAGTLDVRANGSNSIQPITIANMKPTETKSFMWTLKNAGTVDGKINQVDLLLSQNGGVATDAEVRAGDTTNVGNLSAFLTFEAKVGGVVVGHGDLSGLSSGSASFPLNVSLAAGQEVQVTVDFTWPDGGVQDNVCQGDSMTIGATVYMAQA